MTMSHEIIAAISGIVGVFLGILLNEHFRKKSRREVFAPLIFKKRLAAYEGLLKRMEGSSQIVSEVIGNADFTYAERHDLISEAVHNVAGYTDKHRLYLSQELIVHCVALFMGMEDVHSGGEEENKSLKENYNHMYVEALRMIEEDSGVAEINKLFKNINRPNLKGELIDYFKKTKKRMRKQT